MIGGCFHFTTEFTEYHGVFIFGGCFFSPLERGQGGVLEYINMEFCSRFVDAYHTPPDPLSRGEVDVLEILRYTTFRSG